MQEGKVTEFAVLKGVSGIMDFINCLVTLASDKKQQ